MAVAQLVESQISNLIVAGSSPVCHSIVVLTQKINLKDSLILHISKVFR